jgi:predicted HTH transcriptional regulator
MYSEAPGGAILSTMDYLDVKNLAQTGEGTFLEFKRTVPNAPKIAREMAAFANTKGGTLLVGVDDDKSLVGVDEYHEEEFLLKQAAHKWCSPHIEFQVEIVRFGIRDLLVVTVPEAAKKPVYVVENSTRTAYIRVDEQSRTASAERIHIIENRQKNRGVTFQYGTNEQKLFRYLNEYNEINVNKFANLSGINKHKAGKILVNLVSAGILTLFTKHNIDYYAFSPRCKS